MRYKEFTKKFTKESALDQMIQQASGPQAAAAPKQPGMVQQAAQKISSFVAPGSAARSALDGFRAGIGGAAMKNTNIKAPRDAQGNVISNKPAQAQQPQQQQQTKPARISPIAVKTTGNKEADEILKQQGVQVTK